MAGIAATCSSGLILKTKESRTNGASLLQYSGLKAVGSKQVASAGYKPNGSISTSGVIIIL